MAEFRNWLEAGQGEASATTLNSLGGFMRDFGLPSYSLVSPPDRGPWGRTGDTSLPFGHTLYKCDNCKYEWVYRSSLGRPFNCPRCGSFEIRAIKNG